MIWQALLRMALGALAGLVLAFIKNLQAARLDDADLVSVVDDAIRTAASQTTWTNERKRDYAIASLKAWALAAGKDLRDSMAATLVELGVQRTKSP